MTSRASDRDERLGRGSDGRRWNSGSGARRGQRAQAPEGALANCSRHDYGCHVIAIGPFSVVAAEVGKTP